MKEEVKVSVIIPFYSNIAWLSEAVDSVLNQTYKAYEIIIINDGSKEDMFSFILEYGKKVKLISKENNGAASARNVGINNATGEYVAFLDSDDLWLPFKLEYQIYEMKKVDAIWSYTAYSTFEDGNQKRYDLDADKKIYGDYERIYPKLLSSCCIATPCVVIKRDILIETGNLFFNEDMKYGEDLYLWIQLALRYKVLAINKVLTRVRIRGNNAAKLAIAQLNTRCKIWNYIIADKKGYRYDDILVIVKIGYNISVISLSIIELIFKFIQNDEIIEFISKLLYVIPWILFKISTNFV